MGKTGSALSSNKQEDWQHAEDRQHAIPPLAAREASYRKMVQWRKAKDILRGLGMRLCICACICAPVAVGFHIHGDGHSPFVNRFGWGLGTFFLLAFLAFLSWCLVYLLVVVFGLPRSE